MGSRGWGVICVIVATIKSAPNNCSVDHKKIISSCVEMVNVMIDSYISIHCKIILLSLPEHNNGDIAKPKQCFSK